MLKLESDLGTLQKSICSLKYRDDPIKYIKCIRAEKYDDSQLTNPENRRELIGKHAEHPGLPLFTNA